MTSARDNQHPECRTARDAIQSRMDGDLPAGAERALCEHLQACEGCREYEDQCLALRRAMRSMPAFDLPVETREQIESATLGGHLQFEHSLWRRALLWRTGAAAAALVLVVCGTWWAVRPPEEAYSQAEIAQAARDFELAMALTSDALALVEDVTFQQVLAHQVVPAVESIPVRLPNATSGSGPRTDHQ